MAFGVSQTPNINSKAKEKEKARVIALEQVTTKRPNETVIIDVEMEMQLI